MDKWHDLPARQLETRPEAPAFSDTTGAQWNYADLDRAVVTLAAELDAAGVRATDRVLILSENCCAAIAALFACSRLGACAVPVNARQTRAEVTRILDHAKPAAVLFTSEVSGDAAEHARRLSAIPLAGPFGWLEIATPFNRDPDAALADVAVMLFTTGTTGTPKGVMLTHGNLLFGGRTSAELRGMTSADVIYGVLPITHVFGMASVVTAATWAGAQVRLEARFTAARTYAALTSGITLFSGVPQMHALLMQHTREQGFDRLPGGSLRYTSSGAAPLDPAWKREAEAFYGVALQNGYGLTETTAGVCASRCEIGNPDISTGPPLPGVEVDIDESVPGGGDGIGEILTRGPHVMRGYFRNPEATDAVLRDGWFRTGDLGFFDANGHLHISGRSKELIIHGGFNVFPPEVEAVLSDHPQVILAAVVGRMIDGDEKVVAFVQSVPGSAPDAEDLRAYAAERLAGYKRPSQIVVADALPAAPTGKILKHKLLEHFADLLE